MEGHCQTGTQTRKARIDPVLPGFCASVDMNRMTQRRVQAYTGHDACYCYSTSLAWRTVNCITGEFQPTKTACLTTRWPKMQTSTSGMNLCAVSNTVSAQSGRCRARTWSDLKWAEVGFGGRREGRQPGKRKGRQGGRNPWSQWRPHSAGGKCPTHPGRGCTTFKTECLTATIHTNVQKIEKRIDLSHILRPVLHMEWHPKCVLHDQTMLEAPSSRCHCCGSRR